MNAVQGNRVEQDTSSCGDATEDSAKYLDELVKDMRELNALRGAYQHALCLLNQEIGRVWCVLYSGGVASGSNNQGSAPSSTVPPQSTTVSSLLPPSSMASPLFSPSSLVYTRYFYSLNTSHDQAQENILVIQRAYAALVGSHFDPFEGRVTMQEKIPYYPRCNFIGRILGPRGISVKQIESETERNSRAWSSIRQGINITTPHTPRNKTVVHLS